MARTLLKVQGVTDICASEETALLVMTDMEEKFQLTIVCDINMRYQFGIRRGKYVGTDEEKKEVCKLLETTLPETLSAIIKYMTGMQLAVIIIGLHEGQYRAIIEDQITHTAFPIRVSDGVLLSYADQHIPLYIEDNLWEHQRTPFMGTEAKGIAIPINTMSIDMLRQAMQKCIDEERYEVAQQLKEEIERRKE